MRRVLLIAALLIGTTTFSAHSFAQGCDQAGQNSINDSMVANLQQQAANAQQRAAMSVNPNDRARWQAVANSLDMQAQAAQSRQAALSDAAQSICNTLQQNQDNNNDDNN